MRLITSLIAVVLMALGFVKVAAKFDFASKESQPAKSQIIASENGFSAHLKDA